MYETAFAKVYAADLGIWFAKAKLECEGLEPLYKNGYFDNLESLTRPSCLRDQMEAIEAKAISEVCPIF